MSSHRITTADIDPRQHPESVHLPLLVREAERFRKRYPFLDRDEIFSEGYIILKRAWKYYNPTLAQFSTYFVNTVRRELFRKLIRPKKKRLLFGGLDMVPVKLYSYRESSFERVDRKDLIRAITATLPRIVKKRDRDLAQWRFVENVPYAVIAKRLGISRQAARDRGDVVRERLREMFGGSVDG